MIALFLVLALLSPVDGFRQSVNDERGCRLHATGPRLEQEARAWSRQMAAAGDISHSVLEPGKWDRAAEVVGVGPSWRAILDALWESRPHARILRYCGYAKMAVGIYRADGLVWLTARLYG